MRLIILYVCVFVFSSCNLINPDEQEPSYVYIDDYTFSTTIGQGTASEGISELWVYSNSDIVGVYDLPARIPILQNGNNRITVFAGIKNNGVGTNRIRYPFYASYDTLVNLSPDQITYVKPRFTYASNVAINDTRNFESGNFFVAGTNNEGTISLINDAQIAMDGNKCVKAYLNSGSSYMQFIDNTDLNMESGNTVFLELNYSSNNTFAVGTYAVSSGSSTKFPILFITPTTDNDGSVPVWNKIYIDLGLAASQNLGAEYYRIYFESSASESATPTIYLDNLKIVNW
jgi:hypothetical protein